MITSNKIIFFVIVVALGILYDKYREKQDKQQFHDDYDIVRKYLLNDSKTLTSKKPIIWVHLDYEINARQWLNFGSRNTKNLNQPYKYITLQSIINHSHGNFNVCFIDDDSFSKLLPGWTIDLNQLANPLKHHFRTLGIMKVLYYYGGINLPSSYLALNDLQHLYEVGFQSCDFFVGETINRTLTSTYTTTFPNYKLIGCKKQSPCMKELMTYLEILNSTDFTNEQDFDGNINRWLYKKVEERKITMVDGRYIGTKDCEHKPVYIDHLLEQSYIQYEDTILQGIYIPDDEILRRTKYEWFARMNIQQIYESDVILAKYMVISSNTN